MCAAAGESIAAEVHEDDSEESAGERRQRIAREYGFSDDVVERYVLAFHGDETMAHRKMRATYVSICSKLLIILKASVRDSTSRSYSTPIVVSSALRITAWND